MATLEDKILGEKLEYYCSSDEGEAESENDESSDKESKMDKAPDIENVPPPIFNTDCTSNTGPKGVIKDYQRYKQMETERREEQEKERIALAKKLSMTCRSALDEEEDSEFADLLNDPFILEYAKQRMQEMLAKTAITKQFGSVITLRTGDEFLDAIDKEDKSVTIILLLWEENSTCCRIMAAGIDELSQIYPNVKFCKIMASAAGLSRNFRVEGVPAILVYKEGQVIGNYVKLGEEFGNEFTANDISNYLIENGIVLDNVPAKQTIR